MNDQPERRDEHIINESRLISLNSKYATDYLNGSKRSKVVFDFNAIASKDNSILYHTIAIQSAEIPGAFYNITDKNNFLNFNRTSGATTTAHTATIPVGNYNANTFKVAFELAMNAASGTACILTFNVTSGKFQLTDTQLGYTITIQLDPAVKTTLRIPLGIDANATGTLDFNYNSVPTNATFFPFPADFLGITKIKVCSNALAGGNYDSVSLNTSTLIDTIDFNNANWTLTIILNSHRRQMFSKDEGIINFAKMRRVEEATKKPEPLGLVLKELPRRSVDIKEEEDDILLG